MSGLGFGKTGQRPGVRCKKMLAIFVFGVAVGKLVDKIERLDRWKDSEEHNDTHKNNRR